MFGPVPQTLTLTSDKKDSPLICIIPCCIRGPVNANVVYTKQGGFQEEDEDDGLGAKIGACFKKLCCCCCSKGTAEKTEEEKRERNKKTRTELESHVHNSLQIVLPGAAAPPVEATNRETKKILNTVDPEWEKNKKTGVPLSAENFRSIKKLKMQHTQTKIVTAAETLKSQ